MELSKTDKIYLARLDKLRNDFKERKMSVELRFSKPDGSSELIDPTNLNNEVHKI